MSRCQSISSGGATAQDFSISGSISLDHFTCPGVFKCAGSAKLHSSQLNKVRVSGSTKLVDTVANQIHSSGSFHASGCRLGSVDASGSAQLFSCTLLDGMNASGSLNLTASKIHGKVLSSGGAEIVNSTIDQTLESSGRLIKVIDSTIKEIFVKPCSSYSWSLKLGFFNWEYQSSTSDPQKVELSGKSCKVDTIHFKTAAPGVVILKNGAPAPHVINGQICIG